MARRFTDKAVDDLEAQAGIPVVHGFLLESVGNYPFVIVSEHLADMQPLPEAPTEVKKEVAQGLGRLMTVEGIARRVPSMDILNEYMFGVTRGRDGNPVAKFIDLDPQVTRKSMIATDSSNAAYIERVGKLLWSKWCDPDERTPVISAFVRVIADAVPENFDKGRFTADAFMNVHSMSQGVDPEHLTFTFS